MTFCKETIIFEVSTSPLNPQKVLQTLSTTVDGVSIRPSPADSLCLSPLFIGFHSNIQTVVVVEWDF